MKITRTVEKIKARISTLKNLVLLGCKKYIISLIDLEAQLEDAIAELLKPRVLTVNGFEAAVKGSSGKVYRVDLAPGVPDGERCNCPDCVYRSRKCKHQKMLEEYLWMSLSDYAIAKLAQSDDLNLFPTW